MRSIIIAISLFFLISIGSCRQRGVSPQLSNDDISKVINCMTDVMVHDVTNPPLAARFFAYTCLAGYEVVAQNNPKFKSMTGVLNKYPEFRPPKKNNNFDFKLSAVLAMYQTAEKLQPSGTLVKAEQTKFIDSCKRIGFSDEVITASLNYASTISKKILTYAKEDGYVRISNFSKYKTKNISGAWQLTPPAYILPVEPYFATIRPFILDSAAQFKAIPPIEFSTDKKSDFYKLLLANYHRGGNELTELEKEVASFWDCNPFAVHNEGHMMIGLKKISPGAHWMGITGIACKKAKKTFLESMQIYTVEAIGLTDAFITCWQTKYTTNRIRPETAIRMVLDTKWEPLLQTPPFPEYTSGHSVVSLTSAVILSHYFGEDFSFIDTMEVKYGIPEKKFDSFMQAAEEAAISRFYGGIHFMDAIENGMIQGKNVGNWVVENVASKIN